MATKTRIYGDLSEAIAEAGADMPMAGLVDLRHKVTLEQTQVLDEDELRQLRSDYEALRGPVAAAPPDPVPVRIANPRSYRVIGGLLAVLVALVTFNLSRTATTWSSKQVARAATQAPPALPTAPAAAPVSRPRVTQPASPELPKSALEALASGDRELARRRYSELARHEVKPGPYTAAADILTRELRAAP